MSFRSISKWKSSSGIRPLQGPTVRELLDDSHPHPFPEFGMRRCVHAGCMVRPPSDMAGAGGVVGSVARANPLPFNTILSAMAVTVRIRILRGGALAAPCVTVQCPG